MLIFVWIVLALCWMLTPADYAQIYAHVIGAALVTRLSHGCEKIVQVLMRLHQYCDKVMSSLVELLILNTHKYRPTRSTNTVQDV